MKKNLNMCTGKGWYIIVVILVKLEHYKSQKFTLNCRPKRCGNNNKDEDNSPKTLNDKYIHINIYVWMNIYIYIYMHTHTHIYIYLYIYVCINIYVYTHIYVCM